MLINSLMAHSNEGYWEEFIIELERLNVRKSVIVRVKRPFRNSRVLSTGVQRCAASHGLAYDRRPNVLHPGLPSKHGPRHVPEEDDRRRARN